MNIEEIRTKFEEKGEQAYADRKGQIPVSGLYDARILDVLVTMENGSTITIFCGDGFTIIDCTNTHENSYIGIGDTLIEPMKDIKDIKIKWR